MNLANHKRLGACNAVRKVFRRRPTVVPISPVQSEPPSHSEPMLIDDHDAQGGNENVTSQPDNLIPVVPTLAAPKQDFQLEMAAWAALSCKGKGMAISDLDNLMKILVNEFGEDLAPFKNADALKAYQKNLVENSKDGWNCVNIIVKPNEVEGLTEEVIVPFFFRDMNHFLSEEFSNEEYKGFFATKSGPVYNSRGDRVYNHPHNADAWIHLESNLPADHVIAALQVYSDKTLINSKGLSAHPIRATLLNIAYSKRIHNLKTVGYIPTYGRPDAIVKDEIWRLTRLQVFSKCLSHLLQPMKVASKLGIPLVDPDGIRQHVHPRLLSYVADDPELKDVYCIKNGKLPCEMCYVPKTELSDIKKWWPFKSEIQQKDIQQKMASLVGQGPQGKKAYAALSKEWSMTHVPSPLWGFEGQDGDGEGCITSVSGYETMHNEDLGVFLYIVENIDVYFRHHMPNPVQANRLLRTLNARMRQMTRSDDFALPYCGSKGYFPDHSQVQAKEHRNVMQILPHILRHLEGFARAADKIAKDELPFMKELIHLASLWVLSYQHRHRKNMVEDITVEVLDKMEQITEEFNELFKKLILPHLKKSANTIKYHRLSHLKKVILSFGSTRHYNCQFFEAENMKEKLYYKATAMRISNFR
jgi:hypothetical protein